MKRGVIMLALMGLGASGIASADTVVKVGFAGPLTGPVANIGKDEQYGAQLALDDANAKGVTIAGQKVNYIVLDDATDTTTAVKDAKKLISENNVDAIIGSSSITTLAFREAAVEAETPVISSRDGCSPSASAACPMKFMMRSYAASASASVWSLHSSIERYCTEPSA